MTDTLFPVAPIPNDHADSDELYLATRIGGRYGTVITPSMVQHLNNTFGRVNVKAVLSVLWGFPPLDPPRDVYAYITGMCKKEREDEQPDMH